MRIHRQTSSSSAVENEVYSRRSFPLRGHGIFLEETCVPGDHGQWPSIRWEDYPSHYQAAKRRSDAVIIAVQNSFEMEEARSVLKHFRQWLLGRLGSSHRKHRPCCWMAVVQSPSGEMSPPNLARIPPRLYFLLSVHTASWITWVLFAVSMAPFFFGCFTAIVLALACVLLHSACFPSCIKLFGRQCFFRRPGALHHQLIRSLLRFWLLLFWFPST